MVASSLSQRRSVKLVRGGSGGRPHPGQVAHRAEHDREVAALGQWSYRRGRDGDSR